MILYIITVTLKNDASDEITNFQSDLFLKSIAEDADSILSIIVSVISYPHI